MQKQPCTHNTQSHISSSIFGYQTSFKKEISVIHYKNASTMTILYYFCNVSHLWLQKDFFLFHIQIGAWFRVLNAPVHDQVRTHSSSISCPIYYNSNGPSKGCVSSQGLGASNFLMTPHFLASMLEQVWTDSARSVEPMVHCWHKIRFIFLQQVTPTAFSRMPTSN